MHGKFKDGLKEQPGSAEVVKMVAGDKYAIGYSGIGYLTDGVRSVPLAATPGGTCYDTSPASTYSGNYPLARYLNIYLNKAPAKPLDPAILEFAKYILSRDGQTETVKSGFYPITEALPSEGSIRARRFKRRELRDGGNEGWQQLHFRNARNSA